MAPFFMFKWRQEIVDLTVTQLAAKSVTGRGNNKAE